MMQLEQPGIYEEKVKYHFPWVIWLIVISSLSTFAITVTSLAAKGEAWYTILAITISMIGAEGLAIFIIKSINLQYSLTKEGIWYQVFPSLGKPKQIRWDEISEITFKKSRALSNGNRRSYRIGKDKGWYKKVQVLMNNKTGMYIITRKGDEYHFSLNDAHEVHRQIKKLALPLVLKNENE